MYGFVYITMYGVQCTMYKTTWEWVEINEELHGISSSGNLISNPIKDRGYQLLLQKTLDNYGKTAYLQQLLLLDLVVQIDKLQEHRKTKINFGQQRPLTAK